MPDDERRLFPDSDPFREGDVFPPDRPEEVAPGAPGGNLPEWRVRDFVYAILAGFVGALLAAFVVLVTTDTGVVLVTTLVGQYAGHVVGLAVMGRRRRGGFAALGARVHPHDGVYMVAGVALQFAVALVFSPLTRLLGTDESPQALTEMIPGVTSAVVRAILIVAIGFIAPVVEETMFRGVLYRAIETGRGARTAIVSTAAVFALFHLSGLTSEDPLRSAAVLVPQLFIVGLVLGWLRHRHARLGVPIFLHAGFNLVAVFAIFFAPDLIQ